MTLNFPPSDKSFPEEGERERRVRFANMGDLEFLRTSSVGDDDDNWESMRVMSACIAE